MRERFRWLRAAKVSQWVPLETACQRSGWCHCRHETRCRSGSPSRQGFPQDSPCRGVGTPYLRSRRSQRACSSGPETLAVIRDCVPLAPLHNPLPTSVALRTDLLALMHNSPAISQQHRGKQTTPRDVRHVPARLRRLGHPATLVVPGRSNRRRCPRRHRSPTHFRRAERLTSLTTALPPIQAGP